MASNRLVSRLIGKVRSSTNPGAKLVYVQLPKQPSSRHDKLAGLTEYENIEEELANRFQEFSSELPLSKQPAL